MNALTFAALIAFACFSHARRVSIAETAAKREKGASSALVSPRELRFARFMMAFSPMTALPASTAAGRVLAPWALHSEGALQTPTDSSMEVGMYRLSRRSAVSKLPVAAAVLASSVASVRPVAAEEAAAGVLGETYTNKYFCVSFEHPKGWDIKETYVGTTIYNGGSDPMDPEFQVNMLFTPISGDYQKLGALTGINEAARRVLGQVGEMYAMDQGEAPWGDDFYSFNYGTLAPDQTKLHSYSIWFVLPGAKVRATATICTLTVQCPESKYKEYQKTMENIIDSFNKLGPLGPECPARQSK